MKILRRIMRHEWRVLWAERTAVLVIALFALAVAVGVIGGSRWVNFQNATINKLLAEERERTDALLEQARVVEAKFGAANQTTAENWDPRNPYYVGNTRGPRYAFLTPAPLAVTAVGQSDLYPYYFKVSLDLKQNFANTYELENPLKLLAGRFDLAFVLIWLYPLLILALSFNLLAREREDGTLALLLSQPVTLRTIIAGKTLVRALIAFVPVLLCATLGITLAGVNPLSAATLPRFLLWMAAVLVYGLFWFALAALVNARGQRGATNALILAGAWLGFVVLLPSALNALATTLYPVPSRVEYIQALREASESEAAERNKLMAAFYEDHPELSKDKVTRRDEFTLTKERLNQRMENLLQPLTVRFDAQLARQQQFINRFRFLSPALLMQEALTEIAGTGQARYRQFMVQADAYHQAWRASFYPRIARRELVSVNAFGQLPRFRFAEEDLAAVVQRLWLPGLGLIILALIVCLAATASYRRIQLIG